MFVTFLRVSPTFKSATHSDAESTARPRDHTAIISETSTTSGRPFVRLSHEEGKKTKTNNNNTKAALYETMARVCGRVFSGQNNVFNSTKAPTPTQLPAVPTPVPLFSHSAMCFFLKWRLMASHCCCAHAQTHTHTHANTLVPFSAFTQTYYFYSQLNKEASNLRRIWLAVMLPTAPPSQWGHSRVD